MTRINVIPPHLLTDQHLAIAFREGCRPINEILRGHTNCLPLGSRYRLGSSHVLWARRHILYVVRYFEACKIEYHKRGFKGYEYSPDISKIPSKYLNDYQPDAKDYRTNLARLLLKFRKRSLIYRFKGTILPLYVHWSGYSIMVKDLLSLN